MNIITIGKVKIQELFIKFKEKDLFEKTNALSFACLCLFLLDCSVTGGGRYLNILGLSVRMVLGGLSILLAFPTIFKNWKKNITHPINIMVVVFAFWCIICAVRGVLNENNYVTLISDIKGFMYLF